MAWLDNDQFDTKTRQLIVQYLCMGVPRELAATVKAHAGKSPAMELTWTMGPCLDYLLDGYRGVRRLFA
jgi:hypothetical protein